MDQVNDVVHAWLTVPDVADQLGIPVTGVRRMLEDRDLVAVRRGERRVLSIPEAFVGDDGPLPALKGTFTVLADQGFSDEEIIDWLFAPGSGWPAGETAMDALLAGFKTEVRRRAMEEG